MGWPIVGDALYGHADGTPAPRLLLHASQLALTHPLSGLPLDWTSPVPF
jgi:tRNA pseudouridine32 synthase/23S rRNA pseudouridine746 synthase